MLNRILAIDPGYGRCGIAVVDTSSKGLLHSECITTDKDLAHEKRLAEIFDKLSIIIKKWQPNFIILEKLFFSINKKTVMGVAEARGVVLTIAGLYNIEVMELGPQEVKMSIAGVGNANKEQVKKMVGLTLGINLTGKLDDEIDAIALGFAALGHLKMAGVKKALAK